MIATAILAKSGYMVDVYEIRSQYTRNIQWAARQLLIDELVSIDQDLLNLFLKKTANTIDKGSIHLKIDGTKRYASHNGLITSGCTRNIPLQGMEIIKKPSVVTMEAKVFEKMLMKYLNTLSNIHRHIGSIDIKRCSDDKDYYCTVPHGRPDIIIIAEGTNSKTREILGIKFVPASPSRLQIAGNIEIDGGGIMIKHWRNENGIMLSGLIGTKNSGKTWMVADIDIAKITPDIKYGVDDKSNVYKVEKQCLINNEFRRLIVEAMGLSIEKVKKAKINGAIENMPIQPFFYNKKFLKKLLLVIMSYY